MKDPAADTIARYVPLQGLPDTRFGPRIHVFWVGMAWRPLPQETTPAPLPAAPLLTRLARHAVLADPDAHAARPARLIARLRGARATGRIARHAPIRPRLMIPGRASRALDRLTHAAITYICWSAGATLSGAWDTG